MAFGETGEDPIFADMPDNWSTAALNKAVENQLLKGYEEGGKMLIKADNPLTRAEMAAVVNRAFASSAEADISKVTDVAATAWYAKDMAKAVKMGTFAYDTKMRPNDKITREEAFAVLARAFKLAGSDAEYKALNKFSDKADIAAWALKDLDGMAAAGYIQGFDGKLNPKANITRAEFAVVMDNLVKQYIDKAGTVTEVVASGNVVIRVPGVTLQNVTIKGDLVIADGVGEGDVTLDSVKVEGRTVIRGGGENSIIIKGNSDLGRVIVSKVDGKVRIAVEGNANVEIIYVDDGSDDVIVEGTIGTLEVAGDGITVTAVGATLTNGVISGDNSRIVLDAGSTLKEGAINGNASVITVNAGATVDKITVSAAGAKVEGTGTVKTVVLTSDAKDVVVTTPGTKIEEEQGEAPGTGGGGGGGSNVPTPSMSIAGIYIDGEKRDDIYNASENLYTIPDDAEKNNTGIDVTIGNTTNVSYSVSIDIKKGSNSVAHAEASGIQGVYIAALSAYGAVTFDDIGRMFDRLGTTRSGWYKDGNGATITLETDEAAFTEAIDTLFDRMGPSDVYTVTVRLTPAGGSAGELSFNVTRAY